MGWASVHPAPSFLLPYILSLSLGFGFSVRPGAAESGRQIQSWAVVDFGDLGLSSGSGIGWSQECRLFGPRAGRACVTQRSSAGFPSRLV